MQALVVVVILQLKREGFKIILDTTPQQLKMWGYNIIVSSPEFYKA